MQQPTSPLYTPGAPAPHNLDLSALSGRDHSLPLTAATAYPKLALSDLIVHSQAVISDSQSSQVCMTIYVRGQVILFVTAMENTHKLFFFFFLDMQSLMGNRHGVMLKFVLTGLFSGVASPCLVIRMCPPLTTKNWNVYQPLLALGN